MDKRKGLCTIYANEDSDKRGDSCSRNKHVTAATANPNAEREKKA